MALATGFLFSFAAVACAQEKLTLAFLDVGYADSVVITLSSGESILIDAGTQEAAGTVADYLKRHGITSFEAAVITHPQKNHFGGFFSLLDEFTFKQIYWNGDPFDGDGFSPLLEKFRGEGIPVRVAAEGDTVYEDSGLRIRALHPTKLSGGVNENSLALFVTDRNVRFLLTADIGPEEQKRLLNDYPELKKADVVQVPHHGGHVHDAFAQAIRDAVWVVSTGENIWFRPDEHELQKLNGPILRTDRGGHIIITSDGEDILIERKKP